eukprot:2837410-Rhodomonas_salina.1
MDHIESAKVQARNVEGKSALRWQDDNGLRVCGAAYRAARQRTHPQKPQLRKSRQRCQTSGLHISVACGVIPRDRGMAVGEADPLVEHTSLGPTTGTHRFELRSSVVRQGDCRPRSALRGQGNR